MLSVNTNLTALLAQTSLQSSERRLASTFQKIATGKRINSAADDAAGLAISVRLGAQIRGTQQAIRNVNDGISLLQTMDSGAESISNMLQRMRELVVQAENGTNSASDVKSIANEITQVKQQIVQTSQTTKWNNLDLLNGGTGTQKTLQLQIGGSKSDLVEINAQDLSKFFEIKTPIAGPSDFSTKDINIKDFRPWGLAVADLNSDGNLDIVASNLSNETNNAVILFGDGTDNFNNQQLLSAGTNTIWSVKIANVSNGNKQDIFISDGKKIYQFSQALNSSYSLTQSYNISAGANNFSFADINGDGKSDLVTTNFAGKVSVLLNNGSGAFGPPVYSTLIPINLIPPSLDYINFSVADISGDHKNDLIITDRDNNNIVIANGNGDGTFSVTHTYPVGTGPTSVAVTDFNGDGKSDLAVADFNSSQITLLQGNGDGTFKFLKNLDAVANPFNIIAADINGDGRKDLITTSASISSTKIGVMYGNGDGTFSKLVSYAAGTSSNSIIATDFNKDGKQDLIVTNLNSSSVSILSNTTPDPASPPAYPSLDEIDSFLRQVNDARAYFGAKMNSMSFALDNLTNMNVNVSSAASRIGDTDYADVASEMMKEKIIQAGSMSVLAQANLEPQLVLTVLRQFMN